MINKIIRNFIAKQIAGRSDDGIMITLKDPQRVTLGENIMADLLMRNGIDPAAITSENQLKLILQQIKNTEAAAIKNTDVSGIRGTTSAKVFDLEGKEIPEGSQIMGGKQVKNESGSLMSVPDKKGLAGMEYELQNKKAIDNLKQKMAKEKSRTQRISGNLRAENAQRYDIGEPKLDEDEYNYYKEILGEDAEYDYYPVKGDETKEMLEAMVKEQKDEMAYMKRLYDKGALDPTPEELRRLKDTETKEVDETKNILKKLIDEDTEDMAQGGRAGFVAGGITNLAMRLARGFMKVTGRKPNNEEFMKIIREAAERDFAEVSDDVALKGVSETRATARRMDSIDKDKLKKAIDDYNFAQGGRAGFFMGSPLPKGLATLRQILQYMGKKSDVVKNPSDVLKMVNPKSLNAMLNDPRLQGKVNVKEGILASDTVKNFQSKMGEDRVQLVKDMLSTAKNIKKADTSQIRLKNEMIEDMMKKGVDRGMAEEMATTMSRLAEDMAGKFKDTPKLTDEGILELENILKNMETGGKKKRDLNADGGRIGLKDGMNRRTFLKLLGGLASIPIIGKIIKPLKTVKGVKNVPVIKTDNVPGKPEWFDQLVNKVIIEGDDVTKRFATQEREIVHTKKINDTDEVTVYQDLNTDSVRVEYNSPNNMLEEPVDLSYKKTPPDEVAPKGSAEFEVTESGFASRADGPDDFFIDAEEVGGRSIKSLESDVSALKEYATGKGPTMKEIVDIKKRKDKVKKLNEGDLDAQSEYIINRQGEADFASGGIARMLGE